MVPDPGASWISPRSDGIRLTVRVTPRAARSGIAGVRDDGTGNACLAVRVNAPPEGGRANAEVARLVAKRLGVAPGEVTLLRGASGRRKILHVAGSTERLLERLATVAEETHTGRGEAQ